MMVLTDVKGREIHWNQMILGWKERDGRFLERLAYYTRSVTYVTAGRPDHNWDAIELAADQKHKARRLPVYLLARYLGFAQPPVFPPETSPAEKARLRRSISEEAWEEFMAWLKRYYEVCFCDNLV